MTRVAILPNRERPSGDADPTPNDSATVDTAGTMGRVNSKLSTGVETVVDDDGNQRPACFILISEQDLWLCCSEVQRGNRKSKSPAGLGACGHSARPGRGQTEIGRASWRG